MIYIGLTKLTFSFFNLYFNLGKKDNILQEMNNNTHVYNEFSVIKCIKTRYTEA